MTTKTTSLYLTCSLLVLALFPGKNASAGVHVVEPSNLELQNVSIDSESAQADGRVLVEFSAGVRNTGSGTWEAITLAWVGAGDGAPATESVDNFLQYPLIGPGASVDVATAEGAGLSVLVEAADLATLRALILAGDGIQISATSVLVYDAPTKFIDEETDLVFIREEGEHDTLVFTEATALIQSLQPGDILMADPNPGVNGYRPQSEPHGIELAQPYLVNSSPFRYQSQAVVDSNVKLTGEVVSLADILQSGILATDSGSFYDPGLENTLTGSEENERAIACAIARNPDPMVPSVFDGLEDALCSLLVIPVRFNELPIHPGAKLSGELLFRGAEIALEATLSEGALEKIVITIETEFMITAVLETDADVDFAPTTLEIWSQALPGKTLLLGGEEIDLAPKLSVSIGARAKLPENTSVPLFLAGSAGLRMGWDDGEYFAELIGSEVTPLAMSAPWPQDIAAGDARVSADMAFEVSGIDAPSLVTTAYSELHVSPGSDPWWQLESGIEVTGEFAISTLDASVPTWQAPVFSEVGALLDSNSAILAPAATRWGLLIQEADNLNNILDDSFVIALQSGGILLGGSGPTSSHVGRFTDEGEVVWLERWLSAPAAAIEESDGTITIVGGGTFDYWIARIDADGNLLWSQSHRLDRRFTLEDFVRGEDEVGAAEYYLVGHSDPGLVTQSDPAVVKFDAGGEFNWATHYESPGNDEAYCAVWTADGHLLAGGTTAADVTGYSSAGGVIDAATGDNGLLMKIDPDGGVVWANAIAGPLHLRALKESSDGSVFAAAHFLGLVIDGYPSMGIVELNALGSPIRHVLVEHDIEKEVQLDDMAPDGTPPWPPLANNFSHFDKAWDIELVPGGVVVGGSIGLGIHGAAVAFMLNEDFGPVWFTAFDGAERDEFYDMAVTDHGIVAIGKSDSVNGGNSNTGGMLLSLPFEGSMKFAPGVGLESFYLQPRVFNSAGHSNFFVSHLNSAKNIDPIVFVSTSIGAEPSSIFRAPEEGATFELLPLGIARSGDGAAGSFEAWAQDNGLPPGEDLPESDPDGDGRSNLEEYDFGGDPNQPDAGPAPVAFHIENDSVTLEFTRALGTSDHVELVVRGSSDLAAWTILSGWTEAVSASSDPREEIVELRVEDVTGPTYYLQLVLVLELR